MTQATLNFGEIPNISATFEETLDSTNSREKDESETGDKDDSETAEKDVSESNDKCTSCQSGKFEPTLIIGFNTAFCCEFAVRKSMTEFCDKNHHPFQIKATQRDNPEKSIRAKIVYKCTHGVDRSKQAKRPQANLRTAQYYNYTGCTSGVTIRKQADGSWAVRTCILEHITSTGAIAHVVGGKIYNSYPRVKKKFEEEVKKTVVQLGSVNAPTREIASMVSKETGLNYSTKEIRNRLEKYSEDIRSDEQEINDYFHDIIADGGNVCAKYDENNKVRVLLIQTIVQLKALEQVRPNMFFTDTTFSTNKEGKN